MLWMGKGGGGCRGEREMAELQSPALCMGGICHTPFCSMSPTLLSHGTTPARDAGAGGLLLRRW